MTVPSSRQRVKQARRRKPRINVGDAFEAEWPGASGLATDCVLNLYVTAAALEAKSEASVRAAGFPSLAAFNVLTVLHGAGEPLPPSIIAERVFVTRGTLTVVLKSLHRRDLVRLTSHPRDGRMRLVSMSPGTPERVLAYLERIHAAERRLMACLTSGRQRELLAMLAALQQSIEELTL